MDRPDIALVVKASFNNTSRRITFPSAAKCRLNALFARITESFSLGASSFHIAYTDEDGEDFDIVSEADLTEAVSYFSSGLDPEDYGTSVGAPTLYSADWNNPARDHSTLPIFQPSSRNKIVLRVHVVVEYDGPSLSDTASIVESSSEFSRDAWGQGEASSEIAYTDDISDYSSVPSRRHVSDVQRGFASSSANQLETNRFAGTSTEQVPEFRSSNPPRSKASWTGTYRTEDDLRHFDSSGSGLYRRGSENMDRERQANFSKKSNLRRRTSSRAEDGPFDNVIRTLSLNSRPEARSVDDTQDQGSLPPRDEASLTSSYDPRDSRVSLDQSLSARPSTSARHLDNGTHPSSLTSSELGARWIREQTERVRRKLGPVSSSGGSSRSSLTSEDGSDDDRTSIYSEGRGNLELVRETNGSKLLWKNTGDFLVQCSDNMCCS
ncbi:hypothetical protein QFC19_001867 [Naganishia cerealis]|uniref:Uncharacterized protein n=1 Tax=Naganishia cerealis TaxID=610337 RepID=A0ACC2WFP1_9TREE|nr:hypothetical protein QFC19_001867 [Naganishia cerealis]